MWMFFEDGTFYSAVNDQKDPTVKWVRTRDRRSSQLFADFCEDQRNEAVEVLEWPHRDYDYRVQASQDEWDAYVSRKLKTSRATNFKSEVGKNLGYKEGKAFLDALHGVWNVMFRYQSGLRRGSGPGKKEPEYADEGWLGFETWTTRDR